MKRYMVKTGPTHDGKTGYALEPAPAPLPDPSTQPVSRQDILNLQEALVWPPAEMRDINLLEMQKQRNALNAVWEDPNLDPTSKLLKASLHSQLFALANKKHFSKGEPGAELLSSSYRAPPPPTPSQESANAISPASAADSKQAHSLIPRYRGMPLSVDKAIKHVPEHMKTTGTDILMVLKSPASGLTWDYEGKLIDKHEGVRGQGKVIKNTNIQDILSYATNPNPMSPPPRGYVRFRDELKNSDVMNLLSPRSESLFKISQIKARNEKQKKTVSKLKKKTDQLLSAKFLTPPSTMSSFLKKKPNVQGETPRGVGGVRVVKSKLKF